jgi:hypothetical protein
VDYEYLGDALEDAIKALEFALNKSQRELTGMCFNDVGRSIETIEEMKEQIEILEEAIKRYRGRDKP